LPPRSVPNNSPVHHSQLFKYATPSPAAFPYFFVDAKSPFFFTTKLGINIAHTLAGLTHLVPIKIPLPTARQIPMILNWGFLGSAALDADADTEAETVALTDADIDEDMLVVQEGDRWNARPNGETLQDRCRKWESGSRSKDHWKIVFGCLRLL
jgi:hypothetical protein